MQGHPCYSVAFTLLILQFSVECYVNHSSGACKATPVIQWRSRCSFFSFLWSVMSIILPEHARPPVIQWRSRCSFFSFLWSVMSIILPEHARPSLLFSGVHVAHSSVFCGVLCQSFFRSMRGHLCYSVAFTLLILQFSVECYVNHSSGACEATRYSVAFTLLILQFSVECYVNHSSGACEAISVIQWRSRCSFFSFLWSVMSIILPEHARPPVIQWRSRCSFFSFLWSVMSIILPEHARPSLLFSGVHVAHSSVFCGVLCQSFFRSMRGHLCYSVAFTLLILQFSVECYVNHSSGACEATRYSVAFTLLILQFSVECYVNHSSGACEAIPVIQWRSRCSFFSFLWSVMSIILPEHARPSLLFSGVHVAHSSVFCGVLCQSFFRSMRGHPCYSVAFTLLILQFSVECYVNHSSGACEAISVIQWCSRCSFFSFLWSVMSIILPEHARPPLLFSGVRVAHSSVFCVVLCQSLLVFLSSFFVLSVIL